MELNSQQLNIIGLYLKSMSDCRTSTVSVSFAARQKTTSDNDDVPCLYHGKITCYRSLSSSGLFPLFNLCKCLHFMIFQLNKFWFWFWKYIDNYSAIRSSEFDEMFRLKPKTWTSTRNGPKQLRFGLWSFCRHTTWFSPLKVDRIHL